jgi:hypothetical protein
MSNQRFNTPPDDWQLHPRLYANDSDRISSYTTKHLKKAYQFFMKHEESGGFFKEACVKIQDVLKDRLDKSALEVWQKQQKKFSRTS